MKPPEIIAQLEIPDAIRYVSIKDEEAAFLFGFIGEHGLKKTLETGLGFGVSAAHILAAHDQPHIAIDPFQRDYDYQALHNIQTLGFKDRFDFYEDYSHHVLPWLAKEGKTFDFIFIDGDHKFDGIFVDFYYADLLLDTGGFILFHDSWMRSTQLVASFIQKNKATYETVASPFRNFIIFRKIDTNDERNGMHFKEFYTRRSQLKFKVISWLLEPGDSWLKRTVRGLKERMK